MESGAKFEQMKKAYALRGLTLAENGDLSTPAGWHTGFHVEAKFNGDTLASLSYRSKNGPHDLVQVYSVKDGAMETNYKG
jgi:hypothetical protein